MNAMSKEKMIQYLRDYANVQILLSDNPDSSIGDIFDRYMQMAGRIPEFKVPKTLEGTPFMKVEERKANEESRKYFDTMRRVYAFYNVFKNFSVIEDFLLNRDDFISNNDLAGLDKTGCTIINAPCDLTNKKLVQLMRNAFNHNDALDYDRFKMSEDAKTFEIEFKDIRTEREKLLGAPAKPVKIQFDISFVLRVEKLIEEKRQNQLVLGFDIPADFDFYSDNLDDELDRITFVHYYFNSKLQRTTIDGFNNIANTSGLDNAGLLRKSSDLFAFASSINPPQVFHLDRFQKKELKNLIQRYKKNYKELLNDDINGIMYYFLKKVIPVPAMKQDDIEQQMLVGSCYFEDTRLSVNEVKNRVLRVLKNEPKPENYDTFDCELHDMLADKKTSYVRVFYYNLLSDEFVKMLPVITYIDSVITHYCTEKTIKISGRTYDVESLRNSFAHRRWFLTYDESQHACKIIMFDGSPRNVDDYKLNHVGSIDISAFESWADNYMEKSTRRKRL